MPDTDKTNAIVTPICLQNEVIGAIQKRPDIYRVRIFFITILILFTMACNTAPASPTPPPTAPPPTATLAPEPTTTPEPEMSDPPSSTDAASIAVEAAKQYAGTNIRISYEAGLQALDGHFFGPEWTRLTGINVEVVEYDFEEMYNLTLDTADEIDVFNVVPSWQSDVVAAGVLEPLDAYITQYYPEEELESIHPTYRDSWMRRGGGIYIIPDDGDVHILYYRRDLFEDPANQAEFESQYGYALQTPETWDQWTDICAFFTTKYAPELYGCALQHTNQTYPWFQSIFRSLGGEFFDPETMKAQVNNKMGVEAVNTLLASIDDQPPGARGWGFLDAFGAWMDGNLAMIISWPPIGRWSEGYGSQVEQLNWLPETQVAGKVAYAQQPEGGELAVGMTLGVSAQSENKEAAYLFIQWLTSETMSLQRTMTPFSLRDPYRDAHYEAELYKAQWPAAAEYLTALRDGADTGYVDLIIPGAREYEKAEDEALIDIMQGADIQERLDKLAAEWDTITEAKGIDSQREAYLKWRELPNAYPQK